MLGMKILTANEMAIADRVTTDRFGISSLELMEHAGRAVARFVLRELPQRRRIVVLCGKGNNGGDGLVAARHLAEAGCAVSVVMLGDPAQAKGDPKIMLERLPVVPIGIKEEADLNGKDCKAAVESAQLFLDAVLGTGFRAPDARPGSCRPQAAGALSPRLRWLRWISPRVGTPTRASFFSSDAYRADAVVTFTAPKLAHVSGMLTRGPIVVAPIGSPAEAVESDHRPHLGGSLQSDRRPPSPGRFQQRPLRACPRHRRSQGQVWRSFDELGRRFARRGGPGHRRRRGIHFAHRRRGDSRADDNGPARRRSRRNLQPQSRCGPARPRSGKKIRDRHRTGVGRATGGRQFLSRPARTRQGPHGHRCGRAERPGRQSRQARMAAVGCWCLLRTPARWPG